MAVPSPALRPLAPSQPTARRWRVCWDGPCGQGCTAPDYTEGEALAAAAEMDAISQHTRHWANYPRPAPERPTGRNPGTATR